MKSASYRRASFLFFLTLAPQSLWAQTKPEVCEADLRRCVGALAADAMKGRSTGSPEAMEAARYLASELKRVGVEPGGENGTYFQKVPMAPRTEYLAIPSLVCAESGLAEIVPGVDFEVADGGCDERTLKVITAASAEEIPKQADSKAALVLLAGTGSERIAWLKSAGQPDGAGWGLLISLGSKEPGTRPLKFPPQPRSRPAPPTARISVRGNLRQAFVDKKIATLTVSAPMRMVDQEAANVIGRITGVGTAEDKSVAAEVIEFSAHYDHLGTMGVPEGKDGIFNGADDDASGCAVVMELAEAFAHGGKPARTLIFFFATGEEIGLVGSEYALEHPIVPLDKLVLDVNFEMLGRPDPMLTAPARMWLTGFERSNLGEELQRLGVPVVADMRPEQGFFQRSDNYSLAKRGIVAQTLSSFGMHTDYHKVSDDAASLDYVHLEACARGALVGCRGIADGFFRPQWKEGMDPSKAKSREKTKEPKGG